MTKPKTYYIHDNGGRPFKVIITGHAAEVYKLTDISSKNYKLVKTFDFIESFIGVGGNSILLKVKSKDKSSSNYVFIGHEIFSFSIKDKILSYKSPIGNNDVPYPYAVSKDNVYLMLEYVILDKKLIDFATIKDPYNYYYFYDNESDKIKGKKFRKKVLVKRLYGPN